MKNTNYYKTIFKATSLFGVLEVLKIFLRVLTNWFATKIFGVQGLGLVGLIDNTVQLLSSLTNFGIAFTGVREIASNYKKNEIAFVKSVKIINYFSFFSGVLAAIISLFFCKYLSILTFNDANKYWWFLILFVYFVCNNLIQSKTIFLEATQNLNKLVNINIFLSVINSITTILSFYFFGINGIVIAMTLISVINFLVFSISVKQKFSETPKITSTELKQQFKKLIKSGGLLSINTIFGLLCFYILRLFFKHESNGDLLLGYYHVGTTFLSTYLGLVFIAMSKFFYPKLSQLADNDANMIAFSNQQLKLNTLVIMPAIVFVLTFGSDLLGLFFTQASVYAYPILVFGLVSNIFKGFNYTTGFYLLSKNNFKQYFLINLASDALNLLLTIILYKKMDLYGIGLAISVNYFLCACYQYYYTNKKYNFKIDYANKLSLLVTTSVSIVLIFLYFNVKFITFKYTSLAVFIVFFIFGIVKLDELIFNNKIKHFFKK